MADPNGHHRLPAGAPGRLNLGSASAMINSPRTSGGDRSYMSNPSAGDAMISYSAPAGVRAYMINPSAGDAMINSSALAGAHPHMINPAAGDAMINSPALGGAQSRMINPPYAGASSSRLPTASAESNRDWLGDAMAELQQPPLPPRRQEQSVFFPPTDDSFIPSPSLQPVHAPSPSFASSTYSTIPTVREPFRQAPHQVPAPDAPAFPATYPGALFAAAAAARATKSSSPIGPSIPARPRRNEASMGDRKTLMCVHFKLKGWCYDGYACNFAHGEEEQRIVPGRRSSRSRRIHQCDEFTNTGWCRYGRNCKYSHGHGGV